MNISFTVWDLLLLTAVSLMSVAIAYLHHPRLKAFIITLPIPFTLMFLSLGRPIDVTNVSGLLLLLLYTHAVRFLRYTLKLPILACIVLSAALYCAAGTLLASVLPRTEAAFWVMSAVTVAAALAVRRFQPDITEQGHRSPIPLHVKLPLNLMLVGFLLLIRDMLLGFVTLFPMVGVFASYEARNSLWTNCRQIPVIMLTLTPMFITIKLTQNYVSTPLSLLSGWAVFIILIIPVFLNTIESTRSVPIERTETV